MGATHFKGTGVFKRDTVVMRKKKRLFQLFPFGYMLFILYTLTRMALTKHDRIAGVLAISVGLLIVLSVLAQVFGPWLVIRKRK